MLSLHGDIRSCPTKKNSKTEKKQTKIGLCGGESPLHVMITSHLVKTLQAMKDEKIFWALSWENTILTYSVPSSCSAKPATYFWLLKAQVCDGRDEDPFLRELPLMIVAFGICRIGVMLSHYEVTILAGQPKV